MTSAIADRMREHAARGRLAVRDSRGDHSYATILDGANVVAAQLLAGRATLQGERIALLVSPGATFVSALFGVWLAGGCAMVLCPIHPPPESAYMCTDAGVQRIVASSDLAPKLGEAADARTVLEIDALLARAPVAVARALPQPTGDDDALQLYTSGTTGRPKGAILTHENLAMQAHLVAEAWRFSPDDTLLHALPLHHMHGLAIALFTALGAGATVRMLPAFEASTIWNELPNATVFMGVPTMYSRLCDFFDKADAETRDRWSGSARALRLATSGSAALPVPLAARWEAIAGIIPVERFGMTEIGVGMTNPIDGPRKKGSVGHPLPTVETRIVDEHGANAPQGELWVRGPSVFREYFRRADATREAFVDAGDGGRAWFKTGDTVTRDEDGAFRILGRTSVDILKSGGYKLSALEIEATILELAVVREVAVVGVPDEAWGERVVACLVVDPGREAECTEEIIRGHVRQRLAPYKCPKEVRLLAALPRNAMGKVVKPELIRSLST
jgi:malonyl-CoA/methylmalonyl-CoA synthetase